MLTRAIHLGEGKFNIVDVYEDDSEVTVTPTGVQGGKGAHSIASKFMLGAIASCFGQAVLYAAGRLGFDEPDDLVLSVEGSKDKEKFQLGGITVTVEAAARQGDLEAMIDMAKDYCFVSNSLTCPVKHVAIARS